MARALLGKQCFLITLLWNTFTINTPRELPAQSLRVSLENTFSCGGFHSAEHCFQSYLCFNFLQPWITEYFELGGTHKVHKEHQAQLLWLKGFHEVFQWLPKRLLYPSGILYPSKHFFPISRAAPTSPLAAFQSSEQHNSLSKWEGIIVISELWQNWAIQCLECSSWAARIPVLALVGRRLVGRQFFVPSPR